METRGCPVSSGGGQWEQSLPSSQEDPADDFSQTSGGHERAGKSHLMRNSSRLGAVERGWGRALAWSAALRGVSGNTEASSGVVEQGDTSGVLTSPLPVALCLCAEFFSLWA